MTNVMNVYPNQMESICKLIAALDAYTVEEGAISIGSKLPVYDDSGDTLLGWVVDEIGAAWSFQAATNEQADFHRATARL